MKNIENFIIEKNIKKLSNEDKQYLAIIIYLAKKCQDKDIKYMIDRFDDDMLDKFGMFIQDAIDHFDNIPEPLGDETPETIYNFISNISEEEANELIR